MMKKLILMIGIAALVLAFNVTSADAITFTVPELTLYGALQPLPVTPPTIIDVYSAAHVLQARGSVDFDVLLKGSTYSYFYQITNVGIDGLTPSLKGDLIDKYSFDTGIIPLIGNGIMADGLEPVTLKTTGTFGAWLNFPTGLALNKTTNRFYFQFTEPPNEVSGYLIDGGTGTGPVVSPIPEPASLLLLGSGLLGLAGIGRARRKKS